jgi:hypothetical protein
MKLFFAKLEIAILQLCSGQAREKRSWFAMTIEQKTCSVSSLQKRQTADRTRNCEFFAL